MSKDFVSPYLDEAAKRAALIGSKYNHDDRHFRFQREQTIPGSFEATQPQESWFSLFIGASLMIISGIAVAVCLMGI